MEEPGFHLEGIIKEKDSLSDFEGPLSLILILLQKNKIEIRDIKISDILDQYLNYLGKMQILDLEIASDFVKMASYLLYIKTKTLLTSEEDISELEILMQSLEALKAKDTLNSIKTVSPLLGDAYKIGALYFQKPQESLPAQAGEYRYSHKQSELLQALYNAVSISEEKIVDISTFTQAVPKRIIYSIKDKSRQIISKLKLRNLLLNELYSECSSSSEIVATFVSVLELCSAGSIIVFDSSDGSGYEISFTGGNIEEIIEKIEE